MALVSMFLCNQSYASHGRDFLLWVTILNSSVPRETMRETTWQLCLRAAQQQTGASPVTAVAIGSGSAALVG